MTARCRQVCVCVCASCECAGVSNRVHHPSHCFRILIFSTLSHRVFFQSHAARMKPSSRDETKNSLSGSAAAPASRAVTTLTGIILGNREVNVHLTEIVALQTGSGLMRPQDARYYAGRIRRSSIFSVTEIELL